jgi:hypothetical protein
MIRLFVQPFIYSKNHLIISQSKHPYLRRTIYVFIERSVSGAIYLFNKPSTYQSKHLSRRPTIYLSVRRTIDLSIEPSVIFNFLYLFVELSTYLFSRLFIRRNEHLNVEPCTFRPNKPPHY